MDHSLKDLLVSRIFAGIIRSRIRNKVFLISSPDARTIYEANELYEETLRDSTDEGCLTNEELLGVLVNTSMWSLAEEDRLSEIRREIDERKIDMFRAVFKSIEVAILRKQIGNLRAEFGRLSNKRGRLEHATAESAASIARLFFIAGRSLRDSANRPVFESDSFLDDDNTLIDGAVEAFRASRLTESEYREIARTEPWRSYWVAGDKSNIFGRPAAELTEEQRSLILWTKMLDSVYENSECPPDEVIEDDDMLDGWMLIRRRQQLSEKLKARGESALDPKVAQGQEVFIMAETQDDADRINSTMNTAHTKMVKAQRQQLLDAQKKVEHFHFQDKVLDVIGGHAKTL